MVISPSAASSSYSNSPTSSGASLLEEKAEEQEQENEQEQEQEEYEATGATLVDGYRGDRCHYDAAPPHQRQDQQQGQQQPTVITQHPQQQQQQQQQSRQQTEDGDEVEVEDISSDEVICRIEDLFKLFIEDLDDLILPVLSSHTDENENDDSDNNNHIPLLTKRFTLQQCRSYTSIWLVLSYCHSLLLAKRTATLRAVYYAHVTHFRSQPECNAAIAQAAQLLKVPRHKLGLKASPRGWFCGDVQLVDKVSKQVVLDGRGRTSSSQGYPITSDWLLPSSSSSSSSSSCKSFTVHTTQAQCILVIEAEGIYQRLVEDAFFQKHPCVLVTSRGFPDFATRAMVATLHAQLRLPVCGLADCNPYGVSVLHTFVVQAASAAAPPTLAARDNQHRHNNNNNNNNSYSQMGIPHMHWIGLRPSQVDELRRDLPQAVFQQVTPHDERRVQQLLRDSSRWIQGPHAERRLQELEDFLPENNNASCKVELEALNWLGMDFIYNFVGSIFDRQNQRQLQQQQQQQEEVEDQPLLQQAQDDREWLDII